MALRIDYKCINCAACEPVCPNGAIDIGMEIFEIDAGLCTECAGQYAVPQCLAVCQVECIEPLAPHAPGPDNPS